MRSLLVAALLSAGYASAAVPKKMLAAVYTSRPANLKFDLSEVAVIKTDVPEPGEGEVLVKMEASSINPVDHKIVDIAGKSWSYPHKLGFDVGGYVEKFGPNCSGRLQLFDAVWGEASAMPGEAYQTGGTYAKYAVIKESVLGKKPHSLNWYEAGAMPMVSLTGLDALSWAAGGRKFSGNNVSVLVLGGSGGTGHIGIQLAKAMGAARVITTASSRHFDFVRELGADEVIDYHKDNYYDVLAEKSIDVVYDCVGLKETGDQAYPLIKQNGAFVTLLAPAAPSESAIQKRPDIKHSTPTCAGNCSHHTNIDYVSELVLAGKLKVRIYEIHGLQYIKRAFQESMTGHVYGKVVVNMGFVDEAASIVV